MWAKFLKVFLVLMMFVGSLIAIYPNDRAYAVSFTPSTRAIATKILRGVGEKIGIKWTSTSLATVVGLAMGRDDLLAYWSNWTAEHENVPLVPDTGRYLLTPDDFKKNVGIIKAASDGLVPDSVISLYGQCAPNPILNAPVGKYLVVKDDTYWWIVSLNSFTPGSKLTWELRSVSFKNQLFSRGGTTNISTYSESIASSPNAPDWTGSKGLVATSNLIDGNATAFGWTGTPTLYWDYQAVFCDTTNPHTVVPADVPDITNINTTNIFNNYNNVTNYNYYSNYPVVINTVGDGGENIDVPVNPPLTPEEVDNIDTPPVVPPPDADGDGIPDSTDITPNGDTGVPIDDVPKSLWDKLFPVLLIVKLFGLLGSCLMYLIRMFQFIMTIPGIDAIPIDNSAFVWFRSTQIIGIKIYDVVSSLAGVGLSFIVFRAIRRAFFI